MISARTHHRRHSELKGLREEWVLRVRLEVEVEVGVGDLKEH
jgi:hypothetical protein